MKRLSQRDRSTRKPTSLGETMVILYPSNFDIVVLSLLTSGINRWLPYTFLWWSCCGTTQLNKQILDTWWKTKLVLSAWDPGSSDTPSPAIRAELSSSRSKLQACFTKIFTSMVGNQCTHWGSILTTTWALLYQQLLFLLLGSSYYKKKLVNIYDVQDCTVPETRANLLRSW